ncbi:mechanosensitive ion channel domain-containing protein [Candidatus Albibeggiatoa sp. nov. NOAA]|uniref:mechanosensitive ion channel family protein n=1 Tax=Candidatus Albibeggiatoa sp. nov. NOAA TaxID=3162724 RepID=UPI0032F9FAAF|nr:mechanosensitive ion channel family protein [Thiotrichaceae bacterium]
MSLAEIKEAASAILSTPVLLYMTLVFMAFFLPEMWFERGRRLKAKRREQAGLPAESIMNTAEKLSATRFEAQIQSSIFIIAAFISPFIIMFLFKDIEQFKDDIHALPLVFVGILVWSLTSGANVAIAFLNGLTFKTLAVFSKPIQVGDRVTLNGHSGKVLSIGTFYVMLQTLNDDLVSIPTSSLWSQNLVSANAGERSSLCVMDFYLAPFANHEDIQRAEDIIWDSIQASPYFEMSKPMQIYVNQEENSIHLVARAYVASTYNEPLFVSDVSKAFLKFAHEHGLPLAASYWKKELRDKA